MFEHSEVISRCHCMQHAAMQRHAMTRAEVRRAPGIVNSGIFEHCSSYGGLACRSFESKAPCSHQSVILTMSKTMDLSIKHCSPIVPAKCSADQK